MFSSPAHVSHSGFGECVHLEYPECQQYALQLHSFHTHRHERRQCVMSAVHVVEILDVASFLAFDKADFIPCRCGSHELVALAVSPL